MINQKEQLPLLWESDEESHFTCPRKHRSLYYRNSKSKIKGAAFIIKNWPDHISSLLAYWWIGFIMIAITIFIIYNGLSIIDKVTPSRLPFAAAVSTTDENFLNREESSPLNVYMHIIVEDYDDMNDEFYLKYVKRLAKKFTDYKYNIIVMLKDTLNLTDNMNDKTKNEIAVRTILRTDKLYRSEYWSDISIQYVLLSKYLDDSPIKASWKNIPSNTIPFIIRCISIWDKGGIAFDPIIITPLLQNPKLLKDLYNTLKKYTRRNSKIELQENEHKMQEKPKINNIQDIIRILENDKDKSVYIPQYNLTEAESRDKPSFTDIKVSKEDEHKQYKREVVNDSSVLGEKELPTRENKTTIKSQEFHYLKNVDNYKAKISSVGSDYLNMYMSNVKYSSDFTEFTVHLKGNIIATSTSCHAFIGMVFSNIKHYAVNDTIEHIITDELSIFCKGNISSCKYIDVVS